MENDLWVAILNKIDLVLGAIAGLIAKLTWDKAKNGKKHDISGDAAVELSSSLTQRDTVMIWLTDRVHKVKDELNAPIAKVGGEIDQLKLRATQFEKELAEQKTDFAQKVVRLHDHIDTRSNRIEDLIEKLREKQ